MTQQPLTQSGIGVDAGDRQRHRLPAATTVCGLGLIVLCSILGNLYWRAENIMLVGRDSTGHLERTVKVAEVLTRITPVTLYQALTVDDYRPPLLYLVVQPFYRLFGVSFDSAQLANIVLFALVIVFTFLLARRVTTDGSALFAALLVSLLPMPVAMARLFYMEHLLTTMLLLNLLALLAARHWERRGWSTLWGVTLGLGLLVKWTFPIYLYLPILYLLATAGLLQWRAYVPRWGTVSPGRAAMVAGGGVLFLLLWYWPNRSAVQALGLGPFLPVIWFGLAGCAIYLLTGSQSQRKNFWGSVCLALLVAGIWYLPQAEFIVRLSDVAFGTDRGNQEPFKLLRLSNYTRYFGFWVSHHMGLLATLSILPPAFWGWTRRWPAWRNIRPDLPVLLLTLVSPLSVLVWLAQANPRNLVPVVPVIALLLADSLRAYPRRWAWGIGTAWTLVLAVQWAIFTFDGMATLYERTPLLWVHEDYSTWPATRTTDPGNWIQPDVLAEIGSPDGKPATFGMLVDTWQLHRGSFRYLIAAEQRNVDLMSLTEWEGRGWSDMLANQWILVKDGDNSEVHEPGYSVVQRILAGDPLFHALYEEKTRYQLPDGDTAYLYHRAAGPRDPYEFPVLLIDTSVVADAANSWSNGATTLAFSNADVATWVGIHDMVAPVILVGNDEQSVQDLLEGVTGTIITITRYDTSDVQHYLRASSRYAQEFTAGEFTATVVGRGLSVDAPMPILSNWRELAVTDLATTAKPATGTVLPLDLALTGRTDGTLKLSLRLVAPDGTVAAQRDETALPKVETALFLPPDAPPGDYALRLVVYDPVDLAPLPDGNGETEPVIALISVAGS